MKDVCALIRAAAAAGRDARNDAAKRLRLQVDGPFRDARESLRAALEALENDGFPRCDARAPPAELRRLALDLADLLVGAQAPVDRDGRDDATLAATCLVAAADAAFRGKKGGTAAQRASQWASDAAPALAIAEASRAHAVFLGRVPAGRRHRVRRRGPDARRRRIFETRGGGPSENRAAVCKFIGVRGRGLVHFGPARPLRRRRGLEPRLFDRTGHERRRARAALALRRRLRVKRGRPRHAGVEVAVCCLWYDLDLHSIYSVNSCGRPDAPIEMRGGFKGSEAGCCCLL